MLVGQDTSVGIVHETPTVLPATRKTGGSSGRFGRGDSSARRRGGNRSGRRRQSTWLIENTSDKVVATSDHITERALEITVSATKTIGAAQVDESDAARGRVTEVGTFGVVVGSVTVAVRADRGVRRAEDGVIGAVGVDVDCARCGRAGRSCSNGGSRLGLCVAGRRARGDRDGRPSGLSGSVGA